METIEIDPNVPHGFDVIPAGLVRKVGQTYSQHT